MGGEKGGSDGKRGVMERGRVVCVLGEYLKDMPCSGLQSRRYFEFIPARKENDNG